MKAVRTALRKHGKVRRVGLFGSARITPRRNTRRFILASVELKKIVSPGNQERLFDREEFVGVKRISWWFVGFLILVSLNPSVPQAPEKVPHRRNVIVFVADGLRHGSVNQKDSPTLWRIRTEGVHFENSHSLFPTLTTANASAIATGHGLGDTGDFSNTILVGYSSYDSRNFGLAPATPLPFIETYTTKSTKRPNSSTKCLTGIKSGATLIPMRRDFLAVRRPQDSNPYSPFLFFYRRSIRIESPAPC